MLPPRRLDSRVCDTSLAYAYNATKIPPATAASRYGCRSTGSASDSKRAFDSVDSLQVCRWDKLADHSIPRPSRVDVVSSFFKRLSPLSSEARLDPNDFHLQLVPNDQDGRDNTQNADYHDLRYLDHL